MSVHMMGSQVYGCTVQITSHVSLNWDHLTPQMVCFQSVRQFKSLYRTHGRIIRECIFETEAISRSEPCDPAELASYLLGRNAYKLPTGIFAVGKT